VSVRKGPVVPRLVNLETLLGESPKPREFIMGPWLREGESCLLHAKSGLGKTQLALTMAACMAGGGEFIGWESVRPRRVVYADGEMHVDDLRDRLRHLAGSIKRGDAKARGKNLVVFARQRQSEDYRFPDLATPEGKRR
jgi:hypothetical protein